MALIGTFAPATGISIAASSANTLQFKTSSTTKLQINSGSSLNYFGALRSSGLGSQNMQQWSGTTPELNNGSGFDLFTITGIYDNLTVLLSSHMNLNGSFQPKSLAFTFGYNSNVGILYGSNGGFWSITRTGTTYNETCRVTNSSGASNSYAVMHCFIWGYREDGGDAISSSYMTRVQ
jgi:hypothetical protein